MKQLSSPGSIDQRIVAAIREAESRDLGRDPRPRDPPEACGHRVARAGAL